MPKKDTSNAVIVNKIENLQRQVTKIEMMLEKKYVTKDELKLRDERISLLQKLVYGVVGLILSAVALAVVNLVLMQ
jgi:hypothetical protein